MLSGRPASAIRLRRFNQHVGAVLMRLSAPGGREQLDKCLAALSDPDKLGHAEAAKLMTFKETPALNEFMALPREKLYAWTEESEIFVAGNAATESLQHFLKQERNFGFTPNFVEKNWSKSHGPPAEQHVMIERLRKLCKAWGFEFVNDKPDDS